MSKLSKLYDLAEDLVSGVKLKEYELFVFIQKEYDHVAQEDKDIVVIDVHQRGDFSYYKQVKNEGDILSVIREVVLADVEDSSGMLEKV